VHRARIKLDTFLEFISYLLKMKSGIKYPVAGNGSTECGRLEGRLVTSRGAACYSKRKKD